MSGYGNFKTEISPLLSKCPSSSSFPHPLLYRSARHSAPFWLMLCTHDTEKKPLYFYFILLYFIPRQYLISDCREEKAQQLRGLWFRSAGLSNLTF